jgi:hypothetical protein
LETFATEIRVEQLETKTQTCYEQTHRAKNIYRLSGGGKKHTGTAPDPNTEGAEQNSEEKSKIGPAALRETRGKICSEETETGAATAVEKLTRKTAGPVKSQIAAPLPLSKRK